MKKNFKQGFSLAELLIALAIISIIIIMTISIGKKGTENAYNLYYYTAYKAAADAITYEKAECDKNNNNWSGCIGEALGVVGNNGVFGPKNGVTFTFTPNNENYNQIVAEIPSAKGMVNFEMNYRTDNGYGYLTPGTATLPNGTTINVNERKDLLPFYVDVNYANVNRDDYTGKNINYINTNNSSIEHEDYVPRTFGSYENVCRQPINGIDQHIYCRVANPRKL